MFSLSTLNKELSTSFVAPLRQVHGLEMQLFAMQFRRVTVALKLPRKHRGVILIVAARLAFGSLMFLAEMRTSRFIPLERVNAHQLGEFEEIGDAPGALQGLVVISLVSRHPHVAPKFCAQFGDLAECFA